MRSRHCRVCGDWHDLNGYWPAECAGHFATRGPRSELGAPMLIRDSMDPIVSQIDGRVFDSKRGYEKAVREAGCAIVGNEKAAFDNRPDAEPQGVAESLKDAIDQLESGHAPRAA